MEELSLGNSLPRKPVMIDDRGRITIPGRFRESLGLPENQSYTVWIEEYRNDRGECKGLIIRK